MLAPSTIFLAPRIQCQQRRCAKQSHLERGECTPASYFNLPRHHVLAPRIHVSNGAVQSSHIWSGASARQHHMYASRGTMFWHHVFMSATPHTHVSNTTYLMSATTLRRTVTFRAGQNTLYDTRLGLARTVYIHRIYMVLANPTQDAYTEHICIYRTK
jgi:hypothetical protein